MLKKIFLGIGIVLLLLLAVVAFVLWRLDPEELGQEVIRRVNEKGGMQLEARTFSIRPFQGIFMEQARVTGDGPAGRIDADVDELIVEYQLLPILRKKLVIDRIILREPRVEVTSRPESDTTRRGGGSGNAAQPPKSESAALEPTPEQEAGGQPSVAIDEIRVESASLAFRREGREEADLTIHGLDLELDDVFVDPAAAEPLIGVTASGRVVVERIETGEMTIEGGHGRIEMAAGRTTVRDLGVETANANLSIAVLDLDLGQEPPVFHVEAGGDFDLNSFVEAQDEGFGPAALSLTLDGESFDPNAATGEGRLRMEPGTVPAFPTVTKIERLLGEPLITGAPYQVTAVNFDLAGGIVTIRPFRLELEGLQLGASGTIALAGTLDLGVDLRLPRESVDIDALDPLIDGMTDEEGWTVVPFDVEGRTGDPDVSIDMSAAMDVAKDTARNALDDVLDSALDSAEEELRKLLRRNKKDDGAP